MLAFNQYGGLVACDCTSSAFVLCASFALSVLAALTDRQVQKLLAPNYHWLDLKQPFQKGPFVERSAKADLDALAAKVGCVPQCVISTIHRFSARSESPV